MHLRRDPDQTVWLVRDDQVEVRLAELDGAARAELLDELVHDAKAAEAAAMGNAGEDEQVAYLLHGPPRVPQYTVDVVSEHPLSDGVVLIYAQALAKALDVGGAHPGSVTVRDHDGNELTTWQFPATDNARPREGAPYPPLRP